MSGFGSIGVHAGQNNLENIASSLVFWKNLCRLELWKVEVGDIPLTGKITKDSSLSFSCKNIFNYYFNFCNGCRAVQVIISF